MPHGDSTGAQNGIFPPASSSPLCSRTVPWSRHLFSPTNVSQLDGAGSFIAEQGLNLLVRTPLDSDFLPLVKCNCEISRSYPSGPYPAASPHTTPTQPQLLYNLGVENLSILPHPSPKPYPTASTQPLSILNGYPLDPGSDSEEDEPKPEQQYIVSRISKSLIEY